jgi:hypothetical protein
VGRGEAGGSCCGEEKGEREAWGGGGMKPPGRWEEKGGERIFGSK